MPLPLATPPPDTGAYVDAPYAYVVAYRPLDACAPPKCELKSERLVGWWDEVQNDGDRGAYARIGTAQEELYFRRSAVVRPDRVFEFSLPAAQGHFELDAYLAAPNGGVWDAKVEVVLPDGRVALQQAVAGYTQPYVESSTFLEMGDYGDYFAHLRLPLPARTQPLTVRVTNVGGEPLAVGSPLVLQRVERRPRQVVLVVIDAVPEPLFTRMFTSSGDEPTEWLGEHVSQRGTLFARGTSPGFNTPTFIRRFFRSGYYETDGDLGLVGQGIDERLPPTPPSPVTRLVEQGLQAELTIANFLLLPSHVAFGFDGGYHSERQDAERFHLKALPLRFRDWAREHAHDDAFHVVWFTATHTPYPPGREGSPFQLEAPSELEYAQQHLDGVWRNLLSSVDGLGELMTIAAQQAPDVDRAWVVMADHGRTYTKRSTKQMIWLPPHHVSIEDAEHCCLASFEETNTPVAVLYDGEITLAPPRIEEPTSTAVVWRLVEKMFGVDVRLPDTATYDSPELDPERAASRWDDELLVSAGDAGALRARDGKWALRALQIPHDVATLWNRPGRVQKLLTGSPNRGRRFLAEELYDTEADPFEQHDVADQNFDRVLELRTKLGRWLSTYYDPPSHPRYRYELTFPRPVTLALRAPRAFSLAVDGAMPRAGEGGRAGATGTTFAIEESDDSIGVVEVRGAQGLGWVRCATTGLPVGSVATDGARLDLVLARTNCPTPEGDAAPLGPTDVAFRAKLLRREAAGAGSISSDELMEGLRRWGYVRDLDKSKKP